MSAPTEQNKKPAGIESFLIVAYRSLHPRETKQITRSSIETAAFEAMLNLPCQIQANEPELDTGEEPQLSQGVIFSRWQGTQTNRRTSNSNSCWLGCISEPKCAEINVKTGTAIRNVSASVDNSASSRV